MRSEQQPLPSAALCVAGRLARGKKESAQDCHFFSGIPRGSLGGGQRSIAVLQAETVKLVVDNELMNCQAVKYWGAIVAWVQIPEATPYSISVELCCGSRSCSRTFFPLLLGSLSPTPPPPLPPFATPTTLLAEVSFPSWFQAFTESFVQPTFAQLPYDSDANDCANAKIHAGKEKKNYLLSGSFFPVCNLACAQQFTQLS